MSWFGSKPRAGGSSTGTVRESWEFWPCREPLATTIWNRTWYRNRRWRSWIGRRRTSVWFWPATASGTWYQTTPRAESFACACARRRRPRIRSRLELTRQWGPTRRVWTPQSCWPSWPWLGRAATTSALSWWIWEDPGGAKSGVVLITWRQYKY